MGRRRCGGTPHYSDRSTDRHRLLHAARRTRRGTRRRRKRRPFIVTRRTHGRTRVAVRQRPRHWQRARRRGRGQWWRCDGVRKEDVARQVHLVHEQLRLRVVLHVGHRARLSHGLRRRRNGRGSAEKCTFVRIAHNYITTQATAGQFVKCRSRVALRMQMQYICITCNCQLSSAVQLNE